MWFKLGNKSLGGESMNELYKRYNDVAKESIELVLKQKKLSKERFDRCCNEMQLLYDNNTLFVIYLLYMYHIEYNYIYHFRGLYNNLLILYILGISQVDPVKYNLPYELFTDNTLNFDLVEPYGWLLPEQINKDDNIEFTIVKGGYKEDDIDLKQFYDNHYLLLPHIGYKICDLVFILNDDNLFETVQDYRDYTDKYLAIRIGTKELFDKEEISFRNILNSKFELELVEKLKPETMDDYVKIKNLSNGTDVWKNNQEELFDKGRIDIKNIISSREDIFEYLIKHNISNDMAVEITNFIRKGKQVLNKDKWKKYVDIMLTNGCEDIYIDIFSKIKFIFGRGQAISECLFAIDENNYMH